MKAIHTIGKFLFITAAALALLCPSAVSTLAAEGDFTMDDIEFWVGEGENQAVLVIEWDDGILPKTTLAWGYRWDGEATGEDMIRAVVDADDRLFANFEEWPSTVYGTTVYGLGYDLDCDGFTYVEGTYDYPGTEGTLHLSNEDGYAEDEEDLYQEGWYDNFWWYTLKEDIDDTWTSSGTGITSRVLVDGVWDGWRLVPYDESNPFAENTPPDVTNLTAAESPSPFAAAVVDYAGPFGEGAYSYPEAVLGKPATQFQDGAGVTSRVKLVEPAYAYGLDGEPLITTLNAGAYITVRFDHKVLDDPENPYGIDFIVFGNSFFSLGGNSVNDASDMNETPLNGGGWFEKVTVSVSQDGQTWYTYEDGPYGDNLFPTQAYQWDEENRQWTDTEMDWTRPVNPSLQLADFEGKTAAEAIAMYDGSAGGTGFDLAESGFEWIRYIRVESLEGEFAEGEIDAFADVAPGTVDSGDTGDDEDTGDDDPEPSDSDDTDDGDGDGGDGGGGGGGCFISGISAGFQF